MSKSETLSIINATETTLCKSQSGTAFDNPQSGTALCSSPTKSNRHTIATDRSLFLGSQSAPSDHFATNNTRRSLDAAGESGPECSGSMDIDEDDELVKTRCRFGSDRTPVTDADNCHMTSKSEHQLYTADRDTDASSDLDDPCRHTEMQFPGSSGYDRHQTSLPSAADDGATFGTTEVLCGVAAWLNDTPSHARKQEILNDVIVHLQLLKRKFGGGQVTNYLLHPACSVLCIQV